MYTVNVIGTTWGGFESAYSYQAEAVPADCEAAKRIAGDFQDVSDFEVTESHVNYIDCGQQRGLSIRNTLFT